MYCSNGISQAQLPLTDRAVHFGDGFFTTARLLDGDIPFLTWHLKRLAQAGQRLLFSPFDVDALRHEILSVLAIDTRQYADRTLYLQLSPLC